jgi:hypothetical protein
VQYEGDAYDSRRSWTSACRDHVAAVRKVFFVVASLLFGLVSFEGLSSYSLRISMIVSRGCSLQLTCNESVAQHGYLTVATSQVHSFVNIGMGSRCGFFLDVDVVSYPETSVGSAIDPVIGIFSDVDSWTGTVGVGKEAGFVSGPSDGSSSGSSGFS